MKISEIFSAKNFANATEIEWLKEEAQRCLLRLEISPLAFHAKRGSAPLSPSSLEVFFRHRERCEKVRQILQYLMAFVGHIPAENEIAREPVNPVLQFREFVAYEVGLLQADDVRRAADMACCPLPGPSAPLGAPPGEGFRHRLDAMATELASWLEKGESSASILLANLCHVIEKICRFWFDVRRHDIRKTRCSDIYLFLFSQLVRERCHSR